MPAAAGRLRIRGGARLPGVRRIAAISAYIRGLFAEGGILRALRHRDFRLYAPAGFFSNIGLWVQRVGVQWLAWSLTESYAWLAAVALAEAAALMAFLPLFGALVDRGDRLKLGRLAQVTLIVLASVVGLMTLFDLVTIWLLIGLMVAYGTAQAFWTPIRLSMAANLVPREDLPSAIGLGAVLFNLAQFVGPALAGLVLAAMGDHRDSIGYLFLINSSLFVGYLIVLCVIRLRTVETRKSGDSRFIADLAEGLRYCLCREGLGLFILNMLLVNIVLRSYRDLLAGLADGVYGAGVHGFAALQSAAGLGAIFGSAFLTKFSRVEGLTRLLIGAALLAALCQLAVTATTYYAVGLAAIGVLTMFMGFYTIGSQVLVQSAIHGSMRGRVMSLWSMGTRGGPALGAWAVGLAAELWGLRIALAGATALFLIVMLVVFWPKRRWLADTMERPPGDELPARMARRG